MTVKMALSSNEEYNLDQEVIFFSAIEVLGEGGKSTDLHYLKRFPHLLVADFSLTLGKMCTVRKEFEAAIFITIFVPKKNPRDVVAR